MSATPAVDVRGLTKRYGARTAVDALDLQVPAGAVTGFVGPNGAGKTTTIRALLGLVRPSAGVGTVLGRPFGAPEAYLPRVGALVEAPAHHPALSGRANLRVLARLGGVDDERVEQVLGLVGLGARGDDPARSYSLGMRQRLGIAAALLPAPDLLVLDEPTNGLDPAGIREVRGLLRELAERGTTVLVSSHLLAEIEVICDHVVLVAGGRLRFAGPVGELTGGRRPVLRATPEHADDLEALALLARAAGHGARVEGDEVRIDAPADWAGELNRHAMGAGITLVGLGVDRPSLEAAFFAVTEQEEAPA
jgi:ABC-2 type transport system ATP-binding protein